MLNLFNIIFFYFDDVVHERYRCIFPSAKADGTLVLSLEEGVYHVTCFHPLHAWYAPGKTKNGKRNIVFNSKFALDPTNTISLPCGQCVGCRLDRSRRNAVQVSLENQMHEQSIFCTLTYDDEHVPYIVNPDTGEMLQTLKPKDFTLFMKRLRRSIEYHYPNNGKIRFFGCGEYGDKTQRPHFHIIIFGFEPPDKKLYRTTFNGDKLYNSEFLEKCWPKGFINFGSVTFESAAYVARYCMKKITGEMAEDFYQGRCPEFVRSSNRPGIGASWFDKYKDDVYPGDFVVIRDGVKCKPPKYFDKLYEKYFPDSFALIRENRQKKAQDIVHQEIIERDIKLPDSVYSISMRELEKCFYEYEVLPVKEEVCKSKVKRLKRKLEGDD